MFQVRHAHTRWFLWLLALSLLVFVASLHPEVRRRLFWAQPDAGTRRG